jgi:TonB family protein
MNLLHSTALSFALLVACSVKTTCLLALAWIVTRATHRQSAGFRHLVWSVAILGSLILPLLALLLPAWHSVSLANASQFLNASHAIAAGPTSKALRSMVVEARVISPIFNNLSLLGLLVWLVGFLFFSLRLAGGLVRLAEISSRSRQLCEKSWTDLGSEVSQRLKIVRRVRVLECASPVAMPLTWGILRPLVILPLTAREWPEDRKRIVICHELGHVARLDWLFQLCAEFARSFYWFHPLAWIAARNLRQESERACDDSVLRCGIAASEYACNLLDLARALKPSGSAWFAALALARPSNLERRFTAMLNPLLNRSPLSRKAVFLTVLCALSLLLPLAAVRLPAQNLSGKLSGSVLDPSGAAVPNATIIVISHKTNKVEMTTSSSAGDFSFEPLPAGEYGLKVVKPGFEEYQATPIALEPGRGFSQAITLKVGPVMEEVNVVAPGTAKPVAKDATGKLTRIRLGGEVQAPKLLNKVLPIYPETAKAAGIQGSVLLHAVIGMDGSPLSLQVINHQIDPDLARASVEAVSKWRYTPTLLNGQPIEVDTTITVNFTLQP